MAKQTLNKADLHDLLSLHDREFVLNAYRSIFGREADPEGQNHYLARIRSGHDKLTIIADMVRSREGKQSGIVVEGLSSHDVMRTIFAIPVLGRIIEALVFAFSIREFRREMRDLENFVYRMLNEYEGRHRR